MVDSVSSIVSDPEMPWRVSEVETVADHTLIVTFVDGKRGMFDFAPYLEKGVFKKLKNPALFNSAYVERGTVCWSDQIDIAPERLYADCKPLATTEWE